MGRGLIRRRVVTVRGGVALAAALAFAMVGLIPWSGLGSDSVGRGGTPAASSIAVLPFENLTGKAEDATFAHGMHSDLITALSGVGGLTVISRASVLPYRFNDPPLPQIGEELGVDVLLEGGVQRRGDSVRVNVQLVEASTGRLRWAESYNRELTVGNLFAIQSRITDQIVAALQASLTSSERERIARPTTEHLTAYQYAHQAVEAFDGTRDGNHESERLLRLAIDEDPGFARAWADLGVFYSWRAPYLGASTSVWDSAAVFARRALRADPDEVKAYVALAWISLHQGYLDRDAHFAREALLRNPNDAGALRGLAQSYRDGGEFVEALRYFRAAVRVAPRYLTVRSWVGTVHLDLEQHAEAERWYRSALALRSDWPHALIGLALLHVGTGARDSALHYADRSVTRYPDEAHMQTGAAMAAHYLRDFERVKRYAGRGLELAQPGAPLREMNTLLATTLLGFAQLRTGNPVRADSLFAESLRFLEGMVARGTDTPRWPYEIALIRAARGDTEGAMNWLQTAYDRGFRWAWMLEREPMLDPLREDPRFRGLFSRVQADVGEMRLQVERESPG